MSMNDSELGKALRLFRRRIDSLDNDVQRCLCDIPHGPGPAFFPAAMYCFSTLDYFSSHFAGWNKPGPSKDQTARLIDFMCRFLLYGSKESTLAVHFWRHKLMHTAEPRELRNKDNDEVYVWKTGTGLDHHMELSPVGEQRFRLDFDPVEFVEDLRTAILGPSGYFEKLRGSTDLQKKYQACFNEMNNYSVSFNDSGVASVDGAPSQQADLPSRSSDDG